MFILLAITMPVAVGIIALFVGLLVIMAVPIYNMFNCCPPSKNPSTKYWKKGNNRYEECLGGYFRITRDGKRTRIHDADIVGCHSTDLEDILEWVDDVEMFNEFFMDEDNCLYDEVSDALITETTDDVSDLFEGASPEPVCPNHNFEKPEHMTVLEQDTPEMDEPKADALKEWVVSEPLSPDPEPIKLEESTHFVQCAGNHKYIPDDADTRITLVPVPEPAPYVAPEPAPYVAPEPSYSSSSSYDSGSYDSGSSSSSSYDSGGSSGGSDD